jgi:hypothetical protein
MFLCHHLIISDDMMLCTKVMIVFCFYYMMDFPATEEMGVTMINLDAIPNMKAFNCIFIFTSFRSLHKTVMICEYLHVSSANPIRIK